MGLHPSSELETGARFADRYVLERLLGVGGMGKVYLALDSMLPGERVALKVLNGELGDQESLIQRFLREVQLTRRVTHPNVVRTFDVGNCAGRLYFTMEYVEGLTLKDLIAGQPLSIDQVLKFLHQLCSGLSAIHQLDIVHRDLKTSNVIITSSGTLKITDFGVARPGASELTGADELLGSATHIAPETWKDGESTPQSDIYALGVILYEMATGVLPFDGKSPHELMFKHLKMAAVPPVEINPEMPRWLSSLVVRMLDKDPALRPPSAEAVMRDAASRARKSTVEDVRALGFSPAIDPEFGEEGPLLESGGFDNPDTHAPLEGAETTELSAADRLKFSFDPAQLEAQDAPPSEAIVIEAPASPTALFLADCKSAAIATGLCFAISGVALGLAHACPHHWEWAYRGQTPRGAAVWASAFTSLLASTLLLLAPLLSAWFVTRNSLANARPLARILALSVLSVITLWVYSVGVLVSWGAHDHWSSAGSVFSNGAAVTAHALARSLLAPLDTQTFVIAQIQSTMQIIPGSTARTGGLVPPLITAFALLGVILLALKQLLSDESSGQLRRLAGILGAATFGASWLGRAYAADVTPVALSLGVTTVPVSPLALIGYVAAWTVVFFVLSRWSRES